MKNYVNSGDILTMVAPAAGVQSGKFAKFGNICGYPQTDAAEGERFGLKTLGVYIDTVAAAAAVSAGDAVYWDGVELTTEEQELSSPVADVLYDAVPAAGVAEVYIRLRG